MDASSSSKRPACNNCKDRKTKCDRSSPCSSCVAAGLDCGVSRRVPEKRQRIHISNRYDEAMESVDRSLQEVSQALQKLLHNSEKPRASPHASPAAVVANNVPMSEGYRGDSSFHAHVQRVADALRDATANLQICTIDPSFSHAMSATRMIQEAANSEATPSTHSPHSFQVQYPELESTSLPPLEPVLKLIRLAQTEKQRFFIDLPVIREQEFAELCQKVYFAINDYSPSAWVIVNTGLFYLFFGLSEHHKAHIGVTDSDIQANLRLLTANLEVATQSLRLCQDPSTEGCQSLAMLANFCMKSGRSAVAWSLIAGASRMCIDLGWHRLPPDQDGTDISKKRRIFWHVYILDKGMAFTLGRTPSIHQYDVATERPSSPDDLPGALGYVYCGFIEFAVIVGDMHIQLFSASAHRGSQQTRTESAKAFAARLIQVNHDLKQALMDNPPADTGFRNASLLLDIIMQCLVTIAYRIVPCDETPSHPLQCNVGCIDAARQALSTIVHGSQTLGQANPPSWGMFLNMVFSLAPFACFVVLAGNTIASSSTEDLALLSATITAIEPMATGSPPGKKLFEVCKPFLQLASLSVARQTAVSRASNHPHFPAEATPVFEHPADFSVPLHHTEASYGQHIMAPQDWDTVMSELDLGIGAGAMASFVEPYMPFDGRFP